MALNQTQTNAVMNAISSAKYLIEKLKPLLDELDNVYNTSGGLSSTIQQGDLDGIAAFNGMTVQNLADGMYALTNTLRSGIATANTALLNLAVHG